MTFLDQSLILQKYEGGSTMKLVLYMNNVIEQIFPNAENLVVVGRDLSWSGGAIGGLGKDMCFLWLEDEVEVEMNDTVTPELVALNKYKKSPTVEDVLEENRQHKERIASLESTIIDMMDMYKSMTLSNKI